MDVDYSRAGRALLARRHRRPMARGMCKEFGAVTGLSFKPRGKVSKDGGKDLSQQAAGGAAGSAEVQIDLLIDGAAIQRHYPAAPFAALMPQK
ncbi:hypothetical protein EB73_29315 [Mycobacterium sp. SWH-M3]|nr:hypothetical protein EB73_29315 [Mycobacterium sp. SWH-M3]